MSTTVELRGQRITLQPFRGIVRVSSDHWVEYVFPPSFIERLCGITWQKKIIRVAKDVAIAEERYRRCADNAIQAAQQAVQAVQAALGGEHDGAEVQGMASE